MQSASKTKTLSTCCASFACRQRHWRMAFIVCSPIQSPVTLREKRSCISQLCLDRHPAPERKWLFVQRNDLKTLVSDLLGTRARTKERGVRVAEHPSPRGRDTRPLRDP